MILSSALVLSVLCLSICGCWSRDGIDLSTFLTPALISTYVSSPTDSFAIFNAMFYNGSINVKAASSIHTAWSAGISDLSIYVFPCIPNSPFAINSNLQCDSPLLQLTRLMRYLNQSNILFRRYNYTEGFIVYDRNIPYYNTSALSSPILQTLYINIEDTIPNYFFSFDHYRNMDFLLTYVRYAVEILGIEIGFYTSVYDWQNVLIDQSSDTGEPIYLAANGSITYTTNPFGIHKLWTPRFDRTNNMNFFVPFANWTSVYIKQINGDSVSQRRVGSSRICADYMEDTVNGTDIYVLASYL
jgi:hypothetical protein